ncbi:MAG: FadR family transcriptional regulator [Frankia sp.]|nr:FadR family transcriptional regulator [Frankia sp.]
MNDPRPEGPRLSRAERVAADVEEEILAARLPVGAHLGRRAEFMERFRISPTIMNETLRILRDRGLVSVRPGTGGGIFVATLPPQVRLGAMDLWFHDSGTHPLDLFEARVHLEARLTEVAFDRATDGDIAAMRAALRAMTRADDAYAYLDGVMSLHRALVVAARIPVLDGMHQAVIAILRATLSRATFTDGYQEMLRHSIEVHEGIVDAIANRDRAVFTKIMRLHENDLIRAGDPRRSPLATRDEAAGRARGEGAGGV